MKRSILTVATVVMLTIAPASKAIEFTPLDIETAWKAILEQIVELLAQNEDEAQPDHQVDASDGGPLIDPTGGNAAAEEESEGGPLIDPTGIEDQDS